MAGNNANVPEWVQEAEEMMKNGGGPEPSAREEITIKFAKGLVGEPFMSRNGNELVRIKIPNADPADHSPWAEFVLSSKAVHENKYGKGMWAKIPAEGHTTVSRPKLVGQEGEKRIWENTKSVVSNRELKEMVEFYKNRDREPQDRSGQEKAAAPEPDKEGPKKPPFGKDISELPTIKKQLEAGKKEAARKTAAKSKEKAAPKQNKESVR